MVENLKNYLGDDAVDPGIHWNELVTERLELVEKARASLANYPTPVREQFEALLCAGQHGHRIQEDHNFWIDQRSLHELRQVFLGIGRRFAAADVIEAANDIFYLLPDDITEICGLGLRADRKTLVAAGKESMQRWSGVPAPIAIGTDYGPPPDNPVSRALGRFFGWAETAAAVEQSTNQLIKGTPGSPGKVRGVARVIIKLGDSGKLNPGEILVTATTAPPWTPLFATAGGIVTDTGGPLCHCAIVAREYKRPAVVGTGISTSLIEDGQMVEVDGDTGEVRIV